MTFAQQTTNDTFAAQSFDAAEYVVRIVDGCTIWEELDEIVLTFDTM